MTIQLTDMEKHILREFEAFHSAHGYKPSLKELAAACQISLSQLKGQLEKMEAKGIVTRAKNQARNITVNQRI